jgi:methyl-accepting chemotaxis protein
MRADLLDTTCGIGLWDAMLHDGDAMHALSRWTWSAEFRRLCGYESEREFPNVVQSWSDRLHPEDVAPTFALFTASVADVTDRTKYDATYRLKVRDGSYRWFRATGGTRHLPDGRTVLACGSLVDVHEQKILMSKSEQDGEDYRRAIAHLGAGLDALARGDLLHLIPAEVPTQFLALRDNFNTALGKLKETMRQILRSSSLIQSGADEIASATDDMARRMETQAASLEQTAASLNEITSTVKSSAEGARHAREVVVTADIDAKQSAIVVEQAMNAMKDIADSSVKISNIIGVIDEIAFQTNLLALNAGVEAARAGDAGRGFAVVASEVRALAQRSAEAAKEIKRLISASTSQVNHGVKLVSETGKALEKIAGQVVDINSIVSQIADGAKEQAGSLQEVNMAINQMDQGTQTNAAMLEEASAATHSLNGEATQLNQLMTQFVIADKTKGGTLDSNAHKTSARTKAYTGSAQEPARKFGKGAPATDASSRSPMSRLAS